MARPRRERPEYKLVRRGGRWYVRWWQDGAWKRVSTGTGDRRAADRFLAQLAAGLGTPEPPAAPVIAAILDGYVRDRIADGKKSIATLRYASAALKRHLGELEAEHLTKERGRFYASRRRAEGVRDGTIIREIVTLRAALKWAHAERWIDRVPLIPAPPAPPPRERWLTREEAERLLGAALMPHVRLFLALALHTAARSGALLELRWDAVDLDARLIRLGLGSGNKARAVVPINDELLPLLREAKAGGTCDHVIEHGSRPIASVKTGVRAAARRAGLPGVTPHVLRHTAATWMAQDGIPMVQIARFLGHRNTSTTEAVYAKFSPDYLRAAAASLTRRA